MLMLSELYRLPSKRDPMLIAARSATADNLSELMMDSWVAFAATGSPETEATGTWPLHDPLSRQVRRY
jgi:carboxylesterase type B